MRSQPAAVGVQEPSLRLAPYYLPNDSYEDFVDLGKAYGLLPDEWQAGILRDSLGERANGKWAAPRVGVSAPRQNGKNGYIELRELGGLLLLEERILHTAHEVKTAMMSFRRIKAFFENYDDLRKMVKKISNINGQESISLVNGGTLQFAARSKSSGRGFSVDTLILDEAQELSDDVWAAILPTISASPNPQVILLGTPPGPTVNGEVFTRFRSAALLGEDERLSWSEWSADREDDPSDPTIWAKANPALGIRLEVETVSDEFASMDEETFARERLGMWDSTASGSVFDDEQWKALVSQTDPGGRVVFAVDVSPNRDRASIGVAGYLPDGRVMVQTIENRRGTGWVAGRLKELTDRWPTLGVLIDTAGPAASLLPDLKRLRVKRIRLLATNDVKAACGMFYDYVNDGRLAHPDQPVLNTAIGSARKRPLGDAWAWHRKGNDSDITPLVAVTFAAYGLLTARRAATSESRPKATIL